MAFNPATGTLASVGFPSGASLAYNFDGSLPTGVSWNGAVSGSVSFTYDSNLRLASENGVSFTYDSDGLLNAAGALTLTHDPQTGLLSGTVLGSVADALTYNGLGEATSYAASVAGSPAYSESVVRDDGGRITSRTETLLGGVTQDVYAYDAAGRLHAVTHNGVTTTYDYDDNGNRLARTSGASTESSTYDDQDRLLTRADTTYAYAPNGELLSKTDASGTTAYDYDVMGNLRHVALPDGTNIEYVIDGQNRRVGKKVNGTLVAGWLYADQLRIVAELDGTGAVVSQFVYGSRSNVPDYMIRGSATYRIISDHLGSPRAVVDVATGNVLQAIGYDEFGQMIGDSNPGFQPCGFAGGLHDANTGFVRMGARDYDPLTGRWTVRDPLAFGGRSANLYQYCGGDPNNRVDPSGLSAKSAALCFLKGAAVGAVGTIVVGALAIGATTIGAPVAAVTLGLGALAVVGGALLGADIASNVMDRNWDGLAYDAGSFVGAVVAGGASGRAIARGVNGVDSGPIRIDDSAQNYQRHLGTVWQWLSTGPNSGSAGGAAAAAGSGAATAAGGACGC